MMIKMSRHRRTQRMPVRWYMTARARHGQRDGATSSCSRMLHCCSMQLQRGLFTFPSNTIYVNLSLQPLAAHRRTGRRTMGDLATTVTTSAAKAAVAVRTIRVLWRAQAKVEIRMLATVVAPLLVGSLNTTRALFDLLRNQEIINENELNKFCTQIPQRNANTERERDIEKRTKK